MRGLAVPPHSRPMTTHKMTSGADIAGLEGGYVRLTAKQLADLEARVEGPLLRAGGDGWDQAVLVWNAMTARVPALVLQPTSTRDVAAAVSFAREHRVLLGIKGGGHNIGGISIAEGGLTLDMSRLRGRAESQAGPRRTRMPAQGRRPRDAGARARDGARLHLRGRGCRPDARRRPGLPDAPLRLVGGQSGGNRDRDRGRRDPHRQSGRERGPVLGSPRRRRQLRRRHPLHVPTP